MKRKELIRSMTAVGALVLLAPAVAWACPMCFGGDPNSPEARSMTWAVFTLLGVTGGVLSGFVGFMFHLLKRSRQALGHEGASETQASSSGTEGRT